LVTQQKIGTFANLAKMPM